MSFTWRGTGARGRWPLSSLVAGCRPDLERPVDEIVAPGSPYGNEGLTGFPAMVPDSTGALNLVSTATDGDFYVRWAHGSWSAPVLISTGVEGNGVTGEIHSVEQPSLILSQGNNCTQCSTTASSAFGTPG